MDDDLLSIGALSRAGGIPVTALRFYDAAGVLRPVLVDPLTGYRWYTSSQVHRARLASSLRQAGLPVAELVEVLERPSAAQALLARHRHRLEEDLAAACAHLDHAEGLLAQPGSGTVVASELLAALAAVRHAVGAVDPEWPGLAGVMLHLDGTTLRAVACDRARIAVATVAVREPAGAPVRVVLPLELVDEIVTVDSSEVGGIELADGQVDVLGVTGTPLDGAFPDYEKLLATAGSLSVSVTTDQLLGSVTGAGDEEVVVVRLDRGRVELAPPGVHDLTGYSRTFLLEAVRAVRSEQVTLGLDAERLALRLAPADRPSDVGLLMPIRLGARPPGDQA